MSANKSQKQTVPSVTSEAFLDSESRDQVVAKLRSAAERFYERASLEQIAEMEVFVCSVLARRGLLPDHESTLLQ